MSKTLFNNLKYSSMSHCVVGSMWSTQLHKQNKTKLCKKPFSWIVFAGQYNGDKEFIYLCINQTVFLKYKAWVLTKIC